MTALIVFSAVSCDDFLSMYPTNSASADQAISSLSDAEVALSGVMQTLGGSTWYGRNRIIYGDAKGGDLTIVSSGRGLDGMYLFNHTATSSSYSGFWSNGFSMILQLNNMLENIDSIEAQGDSDEDFSFIKGQALTLRAFVYHDLVRFYGLPYSYNKTSYGVPDVKTSLSADAQPARATVEENYATIVSDLEEGADLLSSSKKAVDNYPGYYANLAIRARVALDMEDYATALSASEEIISSGVYSLYDPDEWADSWSSQNGSESIFEIGIDEVADLTTASLGFYFIRRSQLSNAMGWFLASDYYLDRLGEDADDVRWGVMDEDEYSESNGVSHKGACYKYMGGLAMAGDGKSTATAVNIKVIRLSEIYLIAAEAALRTSSLDKAATYLNAIRKRSPNLEEATASTVTEDMILDERSKELFGEGFRFFDMMRLNKTIEFNDDLCDVPVSYRSKTIDRTYGRIVLPIPQDEINANENMQQNSAY